MVDDVLPGPRAGVRERSVALGIRGGPRKHVMIRWSDSHDRSLQLPSHALCLPLRPDKNSRTRLTRGLESLWLLEKILLDQAVHGTYVKSRHSRPPIDEVVALSWRRNP